MISISIIQLAYKPAVNIFATMTLKLYVDMMSQPCRALVMFMKLSGISFNVVPIAIRKGKPAVLQAIL